MDCDALGPLARDDVAHLAEVSEVQVSEVQVSEVPVISRAWLDPAVDAADVDLEL